MKYLLDTCILINHLRGKKEISPEWLKGGGVISSITWGEMMYGVEKSNNKIVNGQMVRALVGELLIEIIDVNKQIAEKFGTLKQTQEKIGFKVDDFDLLIASTALVENFVLVTDNLKHFNKIKGLKLV